MESEGRRSRGAAAAAAAARSRSEERGGGRQRPCAASPSSCAHPDTFKIMEEFQHLYEQRLRNSANCGERSLDVTTQTLRDWVCDLTEQNRLLVDTVEELEKEALRRIKELDAATIKTTSSPSRELEIAEKNERICTLEADLKCMTQKLSHKDAQLKELSCELDTLKMTSKRHSEVMASDMKEKLCLLEREVKCLREVVATKDSTLLQYESHIEELTDKVGVCQTEAKKSVTALRCKNNNLEAEVECLEAEIRQKDREMECLNKKIEDMNLCLEAQRECTSQRKSIDGCTMTEAVEDQGTKLATELFGRESEMRSLRERLLLEKSNSEVHLQELTRKLSHLQKASRDVQSALTAEVAEKHDVIVALRREVSQMEEQLRKSDMQTHFKDDIIKQLRKEVKVARAKESLVEMLGLKVSPRSVTRCEVERLSAELEEREAVVRRLEEALEARTVPRLEAVASQLRARLESSERSVLALCDRISYVRTYLHRLRDDEQLSVKCGLEALIHELNEDLEWNRETRRSVSSLDDGVAPESVIIINRVPSRSLSLPDSTLQKHHEWSVRTWSETNATNTYFSRQPTHMMNKVCSRSNLQDLENVGTRLKRDSQPQKRGLEYKMFSPTLCRPSSFLNDLKGTHGTEVSKLEELQRNLEDSSAKLTAMWQQIKQLSLEVSNNSIYNDLEEFKEDTRLDHETLTQVVMEIDSLLCHKHQAGDASYMLSCFETNLTDMMHLLAKENLLSSDSATSSLVPSEEVFTHGGPKAHRTTSQVDWSLLVDNLVSNISDSLCILQETRNTILAEDDGSLLSRLKELQHPLNEVMLNRQKAIQKICDIQKIQSDSYCNISKKFLEFDKIYTVHQQTSQHMKDELRVLMRRISSTQSYSSSSQTLDRNESDELRQELDCVRQKLSNKEQEILKRDKTIASLKTSHSENIHSNVKSSQSSPFPISSLNGDLDLSETIKHFDDKSRQAQRVIDDIFKEIESTVCGLLDREEKLTGVERDLYCLIRYVHGGQTELAELKDIIRGTDKQLISCNLMKLGVSLAQIEFDLKRFLKIAETYMGEKGVMEKQRIESQRMMSSLQTEFESLQVDLLEEIKVLKDRLSPDSSGYASFRSGSSPDSAMIENLQSQLKLYKEQVQRLEEALIKCSTKSDVSIYKESSSCDWEEVPNDTTAALGGAQQQLMEIQRDMKRTLEEAIKACSKEQENCTEDEEQSYEDIGKLKTTLCDLQRNLESRERVIENQQETIQLLQDGLKRAKLEARELDSKLNSLKCEKENVEIENQRVMQELQTKICSLQEALQKEQTNSHLYLADFPAIVELRIEYDKIYDEALREADGLRDANLELSVIAGHLLEEYQHAGTSLSRCYEERFSSEKKTQTMVAALQVVISHQKNQIKELEDREDALSKQKDSLQKLLKNKSIEVNWNQQQIKMLKEMLNSTEIDLSHHKNEIGGLSIMVKQLRETCDQQDQNGYPDDLQSRIQSLEELNESLMSEKETVTCNLELERQKISFQCSKLSKLEADLQAKTEEAVHWKDRSSNLRENLTQVLEEMQALEGKREEQNISELQSELEKVNKHLTKAREDYSNISIELAKNYTLICKMRTEHQEAMKSLKQDRDDLQKEKENLLMVHREELNSVRQEALVAEEKCVNMAFNESHLQRKVSEKELEWADRLKEKCHELAQITEKLDLKNRECDEKNTLLQTRKEAMDYLSSKVAKLNMFIDEKERAAKMLEFQLGDLRQRYLEAEENLKSEDLRVCRLEKKLGSMKDKVRSMRSLIDELEQANLKLEAEKRELSILVEERSSSAREGEYQVALRSDKPLDSCNEQKIGIFFQQKLKTYKERLRTSLDQNRCLFEMVSKLQKLNKKLLKDVKIGNRNNWQNGVQVSYETTSDENPWSTSNVIDLPDTDRDG